MALRNASGKFSLSGFGRKSKESGNGDNNGGTSGPPSRITSNTYAPASSMHSGDDSFNSLPSPSSGGFGGGGGGGGGAGAGLDGIGRKIGKSIAHTRLLPALGNQDLRLLQDVIASEKSVLTSTEKLAVDMQTASSRLPAYGQQEGPDLQDVLTHSTTLLSQLSVALRTFAQYESSMRTCFKRIREREELLEEQRRKRRTVGQKAESAERKLAKMGPENKQLPQQTELLESLRNQMRQMDSEIINDEAKNGDFKRQAIKEAMSFKFGGLEELGEKMCIIGELGKLLLEEIPLEETPPGYSRAPYNSYDRTENTVNEAVKCLATVKFHASSAAPKPPGLPVLSDPGSLRTPSLPGHHSVADHEQFEHLPRDPTSPPTHMPLAPQSVTDLAYDGMDEYSQPAQPPRKYSADELPARDSSVVWQSPNEDHDEHGYEYEQQRQMEIEQREREQAERDQAQASANAATPTPPAPHIPAPLDSQPGWEPLRASGSFGGTTLRDGPAGVSLHDGNEPSPTLALNREAFAPLSDSFLDTNERHDRQLPQPPQGSGYHAGEESRPSTIVGPPLAPTAMIPAEIPRLSASPAVTDHDVTPTQSTGDLPAVAIEDEDGVGRFTKGSTAPLRLSRGRPISGYIPPVSPPAVNHGETEEFGDPASMNERDPYHDSSRISSSTFATRLPGVGEGFPASPQYSPELDSDRLRPERDSRATYLTTQSDNNPRASYLTTASHDNPRDSYMTYRTDASSNEDAVVVTIPAEHSFRTATPTMTPANGALALATASAQSTPPAPSIPSVSATTPSTTSGPTISAAAFRRGARPGRRISADDSYSENGSLRHSQSSQASADPSSFGHAPIPEVASGGPQRLPQIGTDMPPNAQQQQQPYPDSPPGYDDQSLR